MVYQHRSKSCRPGRGSFEAVDLERRVIELLDGLVVPPDVEDMVRERARQKMEERPDNRALAEALRRERGRLVRLREMRLEGEFDVDEYRARRAQMEGAIEGLEARLGLPEYDAGPALRRVADVGEMVRRGDPAQQRRALGAVFERVEVSPASREIARVVPRKWFGLFFRDLTEVLVGERARRGPEAQRPRPSVRTWISLPPCCLTQG